METVVPPIARHLLSEVSPEPLHSVEIGTIGGEVDQLHRIPIVLEIEPRILGLMCRRIVASDKEEVLREQLSDMLEMETELFRAFTIVYLKETIPHQGIDRTKQIGYLIDSRCPNDRLVTGEVKALRVDVRTQVEICLVHHHPLSRLGSDTGGDDNDRTVGLGQAPLETFFSSSSTRSRFT